MAVGEIGRGLSETTTTLRAEKMGSKERSVSPVDNGKKSRNSIEPKLGLTPPVENVNLKKTNEQDMYDSVGRRLGKIHPSCHILKMKNNIIVSKRCARCLDWFDISMFSLREGKKYPPRYAEYCPVCQWERKRLKKEYKANYRQSKRDVDGVLMWLCSQCKQFKYEQDYSKDSSKRTIRSVCKSCYNQTYKNR